MRRIALVVLVLLVSASDAAAQCMKCSFTSQGCASCVTTSFNSYYACSVVNNGYGCYLQYACDGAAGEQCFIACVEERVAVLDPAVPKLRGEWQLVSVDVSRPYSRKEKSSS